MQISSLKFDINSFEKFATPIKHPALYEPEPEIILRNNTHSKRAKCDKTTDLKLSLIDGQHRCVCRYPKLFRYNASGQCNSIAPGVCENASLDMNTLSRPQCRNCPENTKSTLIGGVPVCAPDSFKNSSNNIQPSPGYVPITDPMIMRDFREKLSLENKKWIKNPCSFDAITGQYVSSGKHSVSALGEYYCITDTSRAVPVRSENDYMTGNGGKYSNGIVSLSDADADAVVIEWHENYNYIMGYRYRVSKLYTHIVDKFNLFGHEYVNIFHSPTPSNTNAISYPFVYSNNFSEVASFENPKPARDNLLLHYVLVGGERVKLVPCDKLGTDGVDMEISPNAEYERYLFDNKRDVLRTNGYIVCTIPNTPGQISFVPNINYSNFTGVTEINNNNIIKSVWYGTDEQLNKYKKIYFDK